MRKTRMTKQRALILQKLRSTVSHPTADEIYAMVRTELAHISLGTVYRNLELLAESNEVQKLEYAGFQKRFDGNVRPHAHVRCECCGKVADVLAPLPPPDMPADFSVPGFTIHTARLEFFGLCKDCAGY
jgi:Fur family ferric uptake transcriptional regulator